MQEETFISTRSASLHQAVRDEASANAIAPGRDTVIGAKQIVSLPNAGIPRVRPAFAGTRVGLVMAAYSGAVEVWGADFPAVCREFGIALHEWTAADAEMSEAFAAEFLVSLLRGSRWLRWRFPRALQDGAAGGFARWLQTQGPRRFGLSEVALKKIRGAFRRAPGHRVRDIYLHDHKLQQLYPLALVPAGQRHFVGWLTTHGRADQDVKDHEVLWFLHETAEDVRAGIGLSYAVSPGWQDRFPDAMTTSGWPEFRTVLETEYPGLRRYRAQLKVPPSPALAGGANPRDRRSVRGANILSHFCYPSGIQQAALWTKAALERAGLSTACRDVPVSIKTSLLPRVEWLGLETHPITIITVAPTPYFATAYERSGCARRENIYRIAYWAWELETVPEEWVPLQPLLDEIWAPTEFVARAMQTRMTAPVYRMLPGVEVGQPEPVAKSDFAIPEDHFVFVFMFDMYSELERKNPLAVIRAFRRAFARNDKATLLIKVSRGEADPIGLQRLEQEAAAADVLLVDEVVTRAKAYGIVAMGDCFVSLHRSEGFGLALAEAMLFGKPVIATRYSGNLDFMNDENSLLVDYNLVAIQKSGPIYTQGSFWADPSEEHAAKQMRQVFDDRESATARGARARIELQEKLSLRAAGERMAARLNDIQSARSAAA